MAKPSDSKVGLVAGEDRSFAIAVELALTANGQPVD
jgi:hypothetical protein